MWLSLLCSASRTVTLASGGVPWPADGGLSLRERVWLSARDGRGLELLQAALARRLDLQRVFGELRLPPQAGRLRARLHQLEAVRAEQADEHGWLLQVDLPRSEVERLAARADGEPLRAMLPPRQDD